MVRVRFAPSPTGHLHIGSVRTALCNYLFARAQGGKFLLRIEDTDKTRSTLEFQKSQIECLEWLGITPDEPIYIQSEQQSLHCRYIAQLVAEGKAYRHEGAVYFKIDAAPTLTFTDGIRGDLTIPSEYLSDFVIERSDGSPIYNFSVVIDDHVMGITHVIRGEDHIANTYKQILLYQAFGWQPPHFSHLPLIVNADGAPLSKRDGVTDAILYRKMGVIPAGLLNYLIRLGWSFGDQELFTMEELCRVFSLSGIGKKPAVFDTDKLLWVNGQHMQRLASAALVELLLSEGFVSSERAADKRFEPAVRLYTPRSLTLQQLAAACDTLLTGPATLFQDSVCTAPESTVIASEGEAIENCNQTLISAFVGISLADGAECLSQARDLFTHASWEVATLTEVLSRAVKASGIPFKIWGTTLRVALTGIATGPAVAEMLAVIGREESLIRLMHAHTAVAQQL